MNNTKRLITMTLVLTLCLTLLTGCRRRNDNNNIVDTTPTVQPTDQVNSTENAMGIVSYVGDSYIAISEYTTDMEITDFADLDTADLTATDNTRYISVTDNTEYYTTVGAGNDKIAKSDLAVGDFITAATVDGVLQITRLGTTDNGNGQTDNNNNNNNGSTNNTNNTANP